MDVASTNLPAATFQSTLTRLIVVVEVDSVEKEEENNLLLPLHCFALERKRYFTSSYHSFYFILCSSSPNPFDCRIALDSFSLVLK